MEISDLKRTAMLLTRYCTILVVRTFKWGTANSCSSLGCKTARDQTWRSPQNYPMHTGKTFLLHENVSPGMGKAIFLRTLTLTSCSFVTPCAIWMHNISFESSTQEHSNTFQVWYLHSKYLHIFSAYLVGICCHLNMSVIKSI